MPRAESSERRCASCASTAVAAARRRGRNHARSATQYRPVTNVATNSSRAKLPSSRPTYHAPAYPTNAARMAAVTKGIIDLFLDLEDGEESFLRDFDGADLLHSFLACLLFFEELALAADVAAVAFCQHVLAQRLDGFARDDIRADGRLDGHVEHLPADDFAHLRHHGPRA